MGEDAALQSLPPPSKIICIGKSYTHNYGRSTPKPRPEPLLFIKPPSSHTTGTSFCIPCDDDGEPLTAAVEVELCVIISRRCKDLRVGEAHEYVSGYALGLDIATKETLDRAKAQGLPWTTGKCRNGFAATSSYLPLSALNLSPKGGEEKDRVLLEFTVDGTRYLAGEVSELIYTIPELVAWSSHIMTLEAGDVIMTGCPGPASPHKGESRMTARMSRRRRGAAQDASQTSEKGEWEEIASIAIDASVETLRKGEDDVLVDETEKWLERMS